MKTLLTYCLTYFLFFSMAFSAKAELVNIPDLNFRNYLMQTYPSCFEGTKLETNCAANITQLNLDYKNISDLTGIEYFTSLKYFSCGVNQIKSLPANLPQSVIWFYCGQNQLTTLPTLPSSITFLDCSNNQITSIPSLPSSVVEFTCSWNQLASLPTLPSSLTKLNCQFNQFTTLPVLPASLVSLVCSYNQLTELPTLTSTSLKEINCDENQLTTLPTLPSTILTIVCSNNQITSLPALPPSITYLNCRNNQIASLPNLPSSLITFQCDENQLTVLPTLPLTLNYISCSLNQLTVLPALPPALSSLWCGSNQLNVLPTLPETLHTLYCGYNQLASLPTLPNSLCELVADGGGNSITCLPNVPTCPDFLWHTTLRLCPPILTSRLSQTSYCPNASVPVSYTLTGSFNDDNIFTAQLSDATGRFLNSVNIGTLNSSTAGTINAVLPGTILNSTSYRIRVVSSSPVIIGTNNGMDLTVYQPVALPIIGNTSFCPGSKGVVYSVSTTEGSTYVWNVPSNATIVSGNGTSSITVDFGDMPALWVEDVFNPSNDGRSISVTETNSAGCVGSTSSLILNLGLPIRLTTPQTEVCIGTTINLTAAGATTYSWTAASGLKVSPQDPTQATVNTNITGSGSFTYTVSGTGLNGCTGTASITINVNDVDVSNISVTPSSATICKGSSITLTASGADNYIWEYGNASITGSTITITPATTTNYRLTGISVQGCASNNHLNGIVNVTVVAEPQITANKTRLFTSANPGLSIQWNLNGSPIQGATVNVYYPTTNGSYSVTVTGASGCSATSSSYDYSYLGSLRTGQVDDQTTFEVYPNPAQQDFSINMSGMESQVKVVITDLQGKILYEGNYTNTTTVNGLGTDLTDGTYIVTVSDSMTKKQQLLVKNK